MSTIYERAACGYQNEVAMVRKYGKDHYTICPLLDKQTAIWRALSCWGAAIKGGYVDC